MKHKILKLTRSNTIFLLPIWISSTMVLAAENENMVVIPDNVDLSNWVCEYCTFEEGMTSEIELGVGNVSERSFKFGEYNGLYDDGAFGIVNGSSRYRDMDGGFVDLKVRDLALDTREVDVKAGRQGSYKLFLNYDEIPHYISDSAETPYAGNGSSVQMLQPGWVNAGSTAGMTSLMSTLHPVPIYTQRKRLSVGADVNLSSRWETAFDVRHEVRDGTKRTSGAFFFNTAQLAESVDYVTDELNASVSYNTKNWQSKFAYYGSFFTNHDQSLTWQNPYTPVAGATSGQKALAPDNEFHQLLFATAYQLSQATNINGNIAIGRMQQNQDFLAVTVNPTISSITLPEDSADAKVDTLNANLKIDSMVNEKLRLNAALGYDKRDNQTPSYLFNWVSTDSYIANPRQNLPYSFTTKTAKLGADYRIIRSLKLSGGYDYEDIHRTNQEVDNTTEDTFWGKLSFRAGSTTDVTFKLAHAVRDASGYNLVSETTPAQNPLMRKYNMADRDRDSGSIHVGFNPTEYITVGLDAEQSYDDYSDSLVGLTAGRDAAYNADISVMLSTASSVYAFAGRQEINSDQSGSQTFSTPDWFAKNDDTIDSLGLGVKHQLIEDKLDIGADYTLSQSASKVTINTGVLDSFPEMNTDLKSLKLYANYRLQENLTLRAAYWYERYESSDWMLDNVNPDTIPNVISFGETSPDYNVSVLMLSANYRF